MALFEIHPVDEQIKALPTVGTAQGSVASFETDMTENLISCVAEIVAQQASGTPTPTDPKTIIGYSSITLTHTITDPFDLHLYTVNFGQTVYGGYIDCVIGKIVIDKAMTTINDLNWTYDSVNTRFYTQGLAGIIEPAVSNTTPLEGLSCECYDLSVASSSRQTDLSISANNSNNTYLILKDTNYTDETSLKSAVGNYKIIYPLLEPTVLDVSSVSIPTYNGENQISGNTNGDTEVKFLLTVGKKIS